MDYNRNIYYRTRSNKSNIYMVEIGFLGQLTGNLVPA